MTHLMVALTGRWFRPVASVLAVALFAAINLIVLPLLVPARLDLTEARLYTVSPGTRSVLSDLSEPLDLVFIYAREAGQDYPQVRAYAARIRQLLASYRALSNGKLRIREIDPVAFSPAEDEALAAGITALQTDGADPLYFGLIGRNGVDDEIIVPFLSPEREATLEYDLTRMIARLDRPEPATVGVISSLRGMSGNGREDGYFVLREIAKSFDVEPLSVDFTQIPPSVDILLVAHPETFSERQVYLIDQFLMARGRALIFLDPASKATAATTRLGRAPLRWGSGLGRLEAHWGISLSTEAVADASHALPVNVTDESGRRAQFGQPLFMAIPQTLMSTDDLVTSSLSRAVNFGAPGALVPAGGSGLVLTALIETGPAPSFIAAEEAALDMHPQKVISAYEAEPESLILAARLSGPLRSAFAGPVLPAETGDTVADEFAERAAREAGAHLPLSKEPVEIILVADSDLLDDGFYIDPVTGTAVGDNATLVLNALDNLAGGQDLVSLRSRASSLRPMVRVQRLRADAEARFFNEQARLEADLAEAVRRLEQLQAIGSTDGFYAGDLEADLTAQERDELRDVRANIVETRQSLRQIERDFRREIDGLERILAAINIWGAAILVGLMGLFVSWRRRSKE